MKKILIAIIALIAMAVAIEGQTTKKTFRVDYISTEFAYLDGGSADGLIVGDTLTVATRDSSKIGLEIAYVSAHSASCKILGAIDELHIGDKAIFAGPLTIPQIADDTVKTLVKSDSAATHPLPSKPVLANAPKARIDGTVSMIYFKWHDRSAANLDFAQSTFRLDLNARHLWGKDITLSIHSRARYDQRQRVLSSVVPQNAWENRIWEFSISYDDPHAPVSIFLGRISPRYASGIGYLDGLMVTSHLSGKLNAGLFSGSNPEFMYNEPRLSLFRGGFFLNYKTGDYKGYHAEQNAAAIGEYHRQNVSRELVSIQGNMGYTSRWSLYHTVELDINRSWRRFKAGNSTSLSFLYLGGNLALSRWLGIGVNYDYRKNYWTYDNRLLPDSLFDIRADRGTGTQLRLTLPGRIYGYSGVNVRKHEGDAKRTYSYFAGFTKSGLHLVISSISFNGSIFSGPLLNGQNYSARIGRQLGSIGQLAFGYGEYKYKNIADNIYHVNPWYEFSTDLNIVSHCFLNGSVQINNGEDIKGTRFQWELGYRF